MSITLFQYPKVNGIEFTWDNLMKKLDYEGCDPYNASGTTTSDLTYRLVAQAAQVMGSRDAIRR